MTRMTDPEGGATEYGCTYELQEKAHVISWACRHLSNKLERGEAVGSTYTIQGVEYDVNVVTGLQTDGSTSSDSVIRSALTGNRSGTPTLVIFPPHHLPYIYDDQISVSQDTFVGAYGAILQPSDPARIRMNYSSLTNAGWFGGTLQSMQETSISATDYPFVGMSRWPERFRFEENYNDYGGKDGQFAIDYGEPGNEAAWFEPSGSNLIIKDVRTYGALRGLIRMGNGAGGDAVENVLIEGLTCYRIISDGIHVTKNSKYVTVRDNKLFFTGDDCVSLVQYHSAGQDNFPQYILVEDNIVYGARARGFTAVGASDVIFRRNLIEAASGGPFRIGPDSLCKNGTNNIKLYDNTAIRCGLMTITGNPNNGPFAALLAIDYFHAESGNTYTLQCTNNVFKRNRAAVHAGDPFDVSKPYIKTSAGGANTPTFTSDEGGEYIVHTINFSE